MKRFLSTMLAAILVIACLAVTVFAADTATVSGSTDYTEAGGTASVTFSISEADFASYSMKLSYDSSVLTLNSITKNGGSGMMDYSTETNKIAYAYSKDETISGALFTANFTVSADAKPGSYPVSVTVSHVSEAGLDGLTIYTEAGAVVIEEPVVECEHTYEVIDSKDPTCTEDGYVTYKCTKCGHTYTDVVAKTGHKISAVWEYDGFEHWHVCEVCGEEFDHDDHGDWQYIIVKEATKEEDGLREVHCGVCDYYFNQVIDKDKDPVPPTGDITPVIALGAAAVITLAGTSLYVFKRKAAK